jgi:hypothetical protein
MSSEQRAMSNGSTLSAIGYRYQPSVRQPNQKGEAASASPSPYLTG